MLFRNTDEIPSIYTEANREGVQLLEQVWRDGQVIH